MPNVVPEMVAVAEAPNRVEPKKAKRQVKKYKREQRKRRKNTGVRTTEKPQNPLVPKGAGRSAFREAAAHNAAQAQLAEQERRASNSFAPNAAYNESANWIAQSATELSDDFHSIAEHLNDQERAELEAHLAEVRQLTAEQSQHAPGALAEEDTHLPHVTKSDAVAIGHFVHEAKETYHKADEIADEDIVVEQPQHRLSTPDEADLFKQFAQLGQHLTDAERAELEAEMEEVKRLSVSVSQGGGLAKLDAEQLSAAFEGLAEHLDEDAKKELEAEVAAVARLYAELGEPGAYGSSWGSQINERLQTAPGPSAPGRGGSKRSKRSKRRKSGPGLVAPSEINSGDQFEPFTGGKNAPATPSINVIFMELSESLLGRYRCGPDAAEQPRQHEALPHQAPARVAELCQRRGTPGECTPQSGQSPPQLDFTGEISDRLRPRFQTTGRGSLGVSWEEFRKDERLRSMTDVHHIEQQRERRKKAELSALWADRIPERLYPGPGGASENWNGPCSVPPLALPEPSLIGVTRVADTIRDAFKGETIQHEERTPRTCENDEFCI